MKKSYGKYKLKSKLWIYSGAKTSWHFLTLPVKEAFEIKCLYSLQAKGWGSLPVSVTIGKTNWRTSIFPSKELDSYILPIKAEVRKKENLAEGDEVKFMIEL